MWWGVHWKTECTLKAEYVYGVVAVRSGYQLGDFRF